MLCLIFLAGLEAISEKLNIPLAEIISYWKSQDDSICLGKLNPQGFWIDHFTPNKKVHKSMMELQSTGIKIGLLTNIYLRGDERAIENGIIPNLDYFSVIKSCDLGLVKPNKRIFEYALEQTTSKPNDIVLIDDRDENIQVAKNLG